MARTALSLFGEAYQVVIDAQGVGLDPTLLAPFIFDLNRTIENGQNALNMGLTTLDFEDTTLLAIDITWDNPDVEMLLGGKVFDDHIVKFLDSLEFYFEDPTIDEQDTLAQMEE